jgi:cysteinyl-tRNA synthetase
VERLRAALKGYARGPEKSPGDPLSQQAEAARQDFIVAMDDDFNSPRAMAQVYDLARVINQARDSGMTAESLAYAQGILYELTQVLGLTMKGLAGPTEAEPFISLLADVRNQLRAAKQWALADQIRDQLAARGVVLEDGPEGTTWKYTTVKA